MIGILDCNNFFASCERVFRPDLRDKPVAVLSNNDGCVIARSAEVKALGIKMGVPFYQIKDLVEKHHIHTFSSNYALYGDLSSRIMRILCEDVPEIEIYSIDEAFLNLDGISDPVNFGKALCTKITKYTGIPVSIGISHTKTLAKLGTRFAKKYPAYNRVCQIATSEQRIRALELSSVTDIWGIGCATANKLKKMGITRGDEFTALAKNIVKANFGIVGVRTWLELNGTRAFSFENQPTEHKQLCTSRSFGNTISSLEELSSAIATFASICAGKLRSEKAAAVSILTFIHTNRHRSDQAQYYESAVSRLEVPTNDSITLVQEALSLLQKIYRKGFEYKKAGVIILEICPEYARQGSLFSSRDLDKRETLMKTVDAINATLSSSNKQPGSKVLTLAAENNYLNDNHLRYRQENISPNYTTNFREIIEIK